MDLSRRVTSAIHHVMAELQDITHGEILRFFGGLMAIASDLGRSVKLSLTEKPYTFVVVSTQRHYYIIPSGYVGETPFSLNDLGNSAHPARVVLEKALQERMTPARTHDVVKVLVKLLD